MTRYVLDTNTAADCIFKRRGVHRRVAATRQAGHKVGIPIPVMAELLAGLEASDSRDRNVPIAERNFAMLQLWPFTDDAAREYGRLYAELRRMGRPMQVVDMMIAAIARTLGNCVVVTTDSDLLAVPGLAVEKWADETPASA